MGISSFINKFLEDMQKRTKDRFIEEAKERGLPKEVEDQLKKQEKERKYLNDIINKYSE